MLGVGVMVGVRVFVGVTVGVNVAQLVVAAPMQIALGTGAQLPQLPTGSCAQNAPQLQHSDTVGEPVGVMVPVNVVVGV